MSAVENAQSRAVSEWMSARRSYLGTDQELVLAHGVLDARRVGWSWADIARVLGTSASVPRRLFALSADFQSGRV